MIGGHQMTVATNETAGLRANGEPATELTPARNKTEETSMTTVMPTTDASAVGCPRWCQEHWLLDIGVDVPETWTHVRRFGAVTVEVDAKIDGAVTVPSIWGPRDAERALAEITADEAGALASDLSDAADFVRTLLEPDPAVIAHREAVQALSERAALSPTPTCPAWCREPAGHPWEVEDVTDGTISRYHLQDVGAVQVRLAEISGPDGGIALRWFGAFTTASLELGTPAELDELATEMTAAAAFLRSIEQPAFVACYDDEVTVDIVTGEVRR